MANLSFSEKRVLEKMFNMESGNILDFSNTTFLNFVFDAVALDIYNEKYNFRSGSKANRLRCFWEKESDYLVGSLIEKLLEYWLTNVQLGTYNYDATDEKLYTESLKIVSRLKQGGPVESIEAIKPITNDKDFALLAKSIKAYIEKNEPEVGLDRLHTFTVRYIRELCNKHNINFEKNSPLHSLFASYVKHLKHIKLYESEMTERILKSSISILEAFNNVRNERSFAHDNAILNYAESLLIFRGVSNVIHFIESIEKQNDLETKGEDEKMEISDLPF